MNEWPLLRSVGAAVLGVLAAASALATPRSVRAEQAPQAANGGATTESASGASAELVTEATAVQRALAHNPTLAAAQTELRRATLLERAERHRYGFVLALDAEANRTAVPNLGLNGVTVGESNVYRVGAELRRHLPFGTDLSLRLEGTSQLTQSAFFNPITMPPELTLIELGPGWGALLRLGVNQPLLRGAGRALYEADLLAARAERASARGASDLAASQLLLDVRTAYWELYYATAALEIQQRSRALTQARLDDTAARIRTGSLAPVEELSFRTSLATIEEAVTNAAVEVESRSNELSRLVGDARLRQRRADVATLPPLPPAIPDDARERALDVSAELAEQRARVELATVRARTAADPLRPRLDIDAFVQTQGLGNQSLSPAIEQLGGLGAWSAHIGVSYEGPLDGTQRRSEQERAELAVTAAQQNLEATRLRVLATLENALSRSQASRRRLELARETRAIAERQLTAQAERFRTGGATALEVREAEDQVRGAELRQARAHIDLIEAHLLAAHLTGRLLTETLRDETSAAGP